MEELSELARKAASIVPETFYVVIFFLFMVREKGAVESDAIGA